MAKRKNDNIPLKSIRWSGVVEGPLLKYRSVQNYENTTGSTIEISYSFPLPYGKSVITQFSAEINGVVRTATAMPKKKATEKYEDAMESGDSPVMLQIEEKDFCTASLGNLKPGEKAKITVEYIQFLEFQGKRARITIPTVLDERYTSSPDDYPSSLAGVEQNIFADYDCTGELLIKDPYDKGTVSSPSHSIKCSWSEEGLRISVISKADRDFVVDLEVESGGVLCLAKDGYEWAALASFIPKVEAAEKPLDLTILLDCSGSMDGSRIEWAKQTLQRIVRNFKSSDRVALYRFGDTLRLERLPDDVEWEGCDREFLDLFKRPWKEVIDPIEADLGGTELAEALSKCGKQFPGKDENSAILLITDGEVWNNIPIIKTAKKTGRRVFTIGIGMAPYSNLLSAMARKTGGTYESVYNFEDIDGAVENVIARLRAPLLKSPQVRWAANALWRSKDPSFAFAADSYTSAALLKKPIEELRMTFNSEGKEEECRVKRLEGDFGFDLVRLVANMRMLKSPDVREQEALGVKYNLAGPRTNFLLVVEREEKDKPDDFAKLSVVPQMPVADRFISQPVVYQMTEPDHDVRHLKASISANFPRSKLVDRFVDPDDEPIRMCSRSYRKPQTLSSLEEYLEYGDAEDFPFAEIFELIKDSFTQKQIRSIWKAIEINNEIVEELSSGLSDTGDEKTQSVHALIFFIRIIRELLNRSKGSHLREFNALVQTDRYLVPKKPPHFTDFVSYMQSHHQDWLSEMIGEEASEREELKRFLMKIFFVYYMLGFDFYEDCKRLAEETVEK